MAEPITEGAGPAAEPAAMDDAGAAAAVTAVTEKKIGTPRGGIRFFLSATQPTAGVCVLRARFPSPHFALLVLPFRSVCETCAVFQLRSGVNHGHRRVCGAPSTCVTVRR